MAKTLSIPATAGNASAGRRHPIRRLQQLQSARDYGHQGLDHQRPPELRGKVVEAPAYAKDNTLSMSSDSHDLGIFAFTFGVYQVGP